MRGFIGIDGGGTGSRGILIDFDRAVLARAQGAALNPYTLLQGELDDNLRGLLEILLKRAKLQRSQIQGICTGLAGVKTPAEVEPVRLILTRLLPETERVLVTHDLDVALRGGTSDGDGVVIVAGTGSACYGRRRGQEASAGGWGHVLGDEGSGYWMSLEALRCVAQAEDGRGEKTTLTEAILGGLERRPPRELVAWSIQATKADVAALAKIVLECSNLGDAVARDIVERAATEVARMAEAVTRRLRPDGEAIEVVLTGGLMRERTGYFEMCKGRIARKVTGGNIIRPRRSAAWGACLIAREYEADRPVPRVP